MDLEEFLYYAQVLIVHLGLSFLIAFVVILIIYWLVV